MASDAEAAKVRAEARFKKSHERQTQAAQAVLDQEADARATREKTDRLRALRLAKEAADLAAAPVVVPKKSSSRLKAAKTMSR